MSWSGFGGEPPRIYPLTLGIYKVTIGYFKSCNSKSKTSTGRTQKAPSSVQDLFASKVILESRTRTLTTPIFSSIIKLRLKEMSNAN